MKFSHPQKILVAIPIIFALNACSEKGKIEEAIKATLKNPDSVKFQSILVSKDSSRACAIWNAKNGFGAYGEWEISELRPLNKIWTVSQKELGKELCNEGFYKLRDETHELADWVINHPDTPSKLKANLISAKNVEHENPELMLESLKLLREYKAAY